MPLKCSWKGDQVELGTDGGPASALCMQTIDGLEADVARGKKDAATQAESAAGVAKALAAADQRLESAAAAKTELEQRIAELKQQLAPFEGRVQAAIAETQVDPGLSHLKRTWPCISGHAGAHQLWHFAATSWLGGVGVVSTYTAVISDGK